ncbi:7 transmembrane receptor (Secretin family) domain-containing protein [Phthorimaea operculella]|nr:7 transmembrane receptor (Secretin family) domain-containing protein [Phthorimaea operculella]
MYTKVVFALVLVSKTLCASDFCKSKDNYIDISKGTHLSNGDIYFKGVKYTKKDYSFDDDGLEKACICSKKTCVRKCCPIGQGYEAHIKKACRVVNSPFDPPVWDDYTPLRNKNASKLFHFVVGKQNCSKVSSEVRIRIGQVVEHIHMKQDGQLYISLPNFVPPYTIKGPDKYCIDTFVEYDTNGDPRYTLDALVCYAEDENTEWKLTNYIVTATCMLISCVFILVTVAVYLWLPELRNLHGRVLMAYLMCLFVAFLFFATMQITIVLNTNSASLCVIFTFIIYYFLEAAFFWLNVMSFDIWWTFSGKRGTNLEKLSTQARFCAYALYAFGVPAILTVVMGGLEFSGLPAHFMMPNIRSHGCFLHGTSRLVYLYGPIVLVVVSNMIFYVLTALKITQIKRQTSVLKSKDSTTHDQRSNDQQRLVLYVKLFLVMGINWLLEVISAIYPVADGFWIITDAYNVLIGLIIFIIFVCKRKIFRLMKKRLEERLGRGNCNNEESMRHMSSRDRSRTEWRNCQNQRASLDTIRSSLGVDNDSVKTKSTQC